MNRSGNQPVIESIKTGNLIPVFIEGGKQIADTFVNQ